MLIPAFWSECRDSNSKQYGASHRLLEAVIVIQEASSSKTCRKRKRPEQLMLLRSFWSECRDSNSRPLEPHSSAIPNFATPGFLLAFP